MSSPALANVALRKLFSRPSPQLSNPNFSSQSSNGPLSNLHHRILLQHHFPHPYSKGAVHLPLASKKSFLRLLLLLPPSKQKIHRCLTRLLNNSPVACVKTRKPLETNACSSPGAPIQRKSAIPWSRSIAAVCVALALPFERDRGKLDCFLSGKQYW